MPFLRNIDLVQILLFAVFWGVVVMLLRRGITGGIRVAGPTLVLRRFDLVESPRDGVFLRIAGRASGPLAWLMTVLGFDIETRMEVTRERFFIRGSSLFGEVQNLAPLPCVASAHCGYQKPIGYLILGALLTLIGVWAGLANQSGAVVLAGLVLGAICFLVYWLSRKLALWVVTSGNLPLGLTFKPSVIENVSVDLVRGLQAIDLLNRKILESHLFPWSVGAASIPRPAVAPAAASRAVHPAPALSTCRACGARLAVGDAFCGECGASASG